jgi:RNA polymerase sigma factor for flagellar operon FliA
LSDLVQHDSADALGRFNSELDLVDLIARQLSRSVGRFVEFDDLLSAGREGLLEAARRYDPSRNILFRTYASHRIRGAMIDNVRKLAALPRRAFERLAALDAANRIDEGQVEFTLANAGMSAGEAEAALGNQLALTATACALATLSPDVVPSVDERPAATTDTPEEQLARAELLAHLQRAIGEIKEPREAEVLRLHYFEGLTMEAIAIELGTDKSWVSRLHRRGLDRLTRRMKSIV